ncbi:MAG: hypothetical protein IJQ42_03595 [Oscillospiraceae bacterium]|jgi:uncharacterized membrane protein|nr:hypothetical protein [Oscillospiraceae bacterium]
MNLKKLGGLILAAILLIGGVILAVRLISGAFALVHGALNTVLGIVVILALLAIVAWMFAYARKHRK